MMTTWSRSQTLASRPKCCLKTPMVPGPHTSCVMRTSTSTQMFSPGCTLSRPPEPHAMTTAPTCHLVTLGCKVNQYETQYVKEALELNGYREAEGGEPVDLCAVNTCTVTRDGDAKSRQIIRRLHQAYPRAAIVV